MFNVINKVITDIKGMCCQNTLPQTRLKITTRVEMPASQSLFDLFCGN